MTPVKPLDIVRTPKGAYGIVTETGDGGESASINYFGGGNPSGEKSAWWCAEDGLQVIDSLPRATPTAYATAPKASSSAKPPPKTSTAMAFVTLITPPMNQPIKRIHVIPIADEDIHAAQETCWCHPTEIEPNIWVHNAKDCREARERFTDEKHSEGWINIAEFVIP